MVVLGATQDVLGRVLDIGLKWRAYDGNFKMYPKSIQGLELN